ncbi:hypothetical protein OC842_006501 [Tilletia horrida]|uniref:Fungal lipase-type domain-containing protein n=1 Tax=Tilletia horrida TaxID=155126 RepID=A0AAN6G8F5_9BASI|nr:hypothetical protein OC842_006501 [Tilletia horrida]
MVSCLSALFLTIAAVLARPPVVTASPLVITRRGQTGSQLGDIVDLTNPDPIPAVAASGAYPLTTSAEPIPLSAELRDLITTKTTKYAGAAYCPSIYRGEWKCGPYCDANPDFNVTAWGGDGNIQQRYYVGWNPTTKEIVATRQGADFRELVTFLYVLNFLPARLHPDLARTLSRVSGPRSASYVPVGFLGTLATLLPSGQSEVNYAVVNAGSQAAWAADYAAIKAAVQDQLDAHPDTHGLFISGHSMGAAMAVLDGIALRGLVPKSISVQIGVTGQPRIGNPVFAALVDALGQDASQKFDYHRVSNFNDPFVHLFPMFLGYQHSVGEMWMPQANSTADSPALFCVGRENIHCADGIKGSDLDYHAHIGPYLGIYVRPEGCTD